MARLNDFRTKIGYGIRPNLFNVSLNNAPAGVPVGLTDLTKVGFLCRSAGIPASNIGTVEVPFRGRVIKLPGDRTFESWTITIFADPGMEIRTYLEAWMNAMNSHTGGAGVTAASDYTATLKVDLLGRGNASQTPTLDTPHNIIKSYNFVNAFPTNISQIDLSYDNNNSIAEYTVEFQYDYWLDAAGSGGTAGTTIATPNNGNIISQ